MEKAEKAFGENVKIYSPIKERQIRVPNSEQKSLLLRPVDNWIELSAWLYTSAAAERLNAQVEKKWCYQSLRCAKDRLN